MFAINASLETKTFVTNENELSFEDMGDLQTRFVCKINGHLHYLKTLTQALLDHYSVEEQLYLRLL